MVGTKWNWYEGNQTAQIRTQTIGSLHQSVPEDNTKLYGQERKKEVKTDLIKLTP